MSAPRLADATNTAGLRSLPVDPDEGFPQSFLLALGEHRYRFEFYVAIAEHALPNAVDLRMTLDLVGGIAGHDAAGLLIGAVVRESADGTLLPLLRRRLLPGLVYEAHELVLCIDRVSIAVGNLNGLGSYGSILDARVGLR